MTGAGIANPLGGFPSQHATLQHFIKFSIEVNNFPYQIIATDGSYCGFSTLFVYVGLASERHCRILETAQKMALHNLLQLHKLTVSATQAVKPEKEGWRKFRKTHTCNSFPAAKCPRTLFPIPRHKACQRGRWQGIQIRSFIPRSTQSMLTNQNQSPSIGTYCSLVLYSHNFRYVKFLQHH